MRAPPVALTLALALALALPATAQHCASWDTMNAITVDKYYVIEDCWLAPFIGAHGPWCQNDGPFMGLWIYEESNGIPGLQRGDEWHDGTCHGMIEPDRIVF